MIIGTGLDVVELDRIVNLIHHDKFISRILTPTEINLYIKRTDKRKTEFLAGRFAAKEAYAKAKGTGIGKNLSWQDIEIVNDMQGKPILNDRMNQEQVIHLSITHTRTTAAAFVIIESLSS
ncbi:holo-[acyl-carrier-protein] synthase [Scopulibacillus darangshiensis]|uniref:Holo-[acyl-carrier-protein] synthase n=1 Tax=Scopulibacillus darangshiensis TaxID=442528 RepID=A0A4R2NPV8_9BACL|nr:holo-ACP synthase [Scopulibacillus darangshiensis]TCP23820.1 holo-[acyl-carrier-protein] synthase [Scopulibacillus darangshiensis]